MVPALLRAKERESGQVIGTDRLLVCEGTVCLHDNTPQPDGGGKMPDLVIRFRHTEVNIAPESIVQGKKFRCDLIGYF